MKLVKIKTNKNEKPRRKVLEWLEKNFGDRNKLYWLDDEEVDDDGWGNNRYMAVWFENDQHASMFLLKWDN
jgi:hypothetical protein